MSLSFGLASDGVEGGGCGLLTQRLFISSMVRFVSWVARPWPWREGSTTMARSSHWGVEVFSASGWGLGGGGRLKRCVAFEESMDEAMGVLGW